MGAGHSFPAVSVVLSMTTVPWRLHDEFATRIIQLMHGLPKNVQLHLNVPLFLTRKQMAYPAIPAVIQTHPRIHVFRTPDYGPITKVIPTLERLLFTNAIVLILDDDNFYSHTFIRRVLENTTSYTQTIRSKIGDWHGQQFPQGYAGIVLPMLLMTPAIIADLKRAVHNTFSPCFTSDDFVMGVVFTQHGLQFTNFAIEKFGTTDFDNKLSRADAQALWRQNHYVAYAKCQCELRAITASSSSSAGRT